MDTKPKVLVVDDEERARRLMEALLTPLGYDVLLAADGEEALDLVPKASPDLILLDVMMPKMDGMEVARRLKEGAETRSIPIVMVTALDAAEDRVKAMEAGADDFLSKPVDRTELKARVQSLLKVKAYNDHMRDYRKELESEVSRKTRQLSDAFERIRTSSLETIYRLSRAAESKDQETGAHIQRMSRYAATIAVKMGLGEQFAEDILYAAPMHDVGKIGTPDHILQKAGELGWDEWEIMRQHTIVGARILEGSSAEFIKLGEVIALTHHEKWDGSGYWRGLKGAEIPLAGRIVAVADVFDALTSRRPYRKQPYSLEQAFEMIEGERGKHFDPDVVDAFLAAKDQIMAIRRDYK